MTIEEQKMLTLMANLKLAMLKLKSIKMSEINSNVASKILNLDKAIKELEDEIGQ